MTTNTRLIAMLISWMLLAVISKAGSGEQGAGAGRNFLISLFVIPYILSKNSMLERGHLRTGAG